MLPDRHVSLQSLEPGETARDIHALIAAISDLSGQARCITSGAAFEAARHGMHGPGFALLAEELRNLTSQSSTAARRIGTLVCSIKNGVALSDAENSLHTNVDTFVETSESICQLAKAIEEVAQPQSAASLSLLPQPANNEGPLAVQKIVVSSRELARLAREMNRAVSAFIN